MMATAREAWQFTPNVISHFEKEAEHFLLEDKRRKEKLRQLKVGHFFLVDVSKQHNWAIRPMSSNQLVETKIPQLWAFGSITFLNQ